MTASGLPDAAAASVTAPAAAPASGKPEAVKIYFGAGAAAAPADAAAQLKAIAEHAAKTSGVKLDISGYHDKTGDPAKNAELAKQRAMGVKEMLIKAGVTEASLHMKKPVEMTGSADDKEARRVEVSVAQ